MYKRDFNSFLDPVHQIRRIKSWKFKRQVVYFVPVPKVCRIMAEDCRLGHGRAAKHLVICHNKIRARLNGRSLTLKVNFRGLNSLIRNETVTVQNPDWEFIRGQIEFLRTSLGFLEFDWHTSLDDDYLSINNTAVNDAINGYVIYSERKQLISEAKTFSSEMVSTLLGESLEHNTVDDLDVVLGMLDNFAESGKYVDNKPYVWLDRGSPMLSKRYDNHWL